MLLELDFGRINFAIKTHYLMSTFLKSPFHMLICSSDVFFAFGIKINLCRNVGSTSSNVQKVNRSSGKV